MRKTIIIIGAAMVSLFAATLMFQNPIEAEAVLEPREARHVSDAARPAPEEGIDMLSVAAEVTPPAPRPAPIRMAQYAANDPVVNGLLRMCVSEAGFFSHADCVGIWQVIQNVRSRSCDRTIRKITECDENGETTLSAMRRLSPVAMKQRPAPTQRQRYVQGITVLCEEPRGFRGAEPNAHWENYREPCLELAELAMELASGVSRERFPVATVIAWGGRCEARGGACDDGIACRRGLARVESDTRNAFWCTPGARGCASTRDPLCDELDL
jgi:hypothetical protein